MGAVLAMLTLIAAIAVVAVLALGDGGRAVQLRRVVADDAQQAVEQLQSLIDDNTK
jgi:phosphotransferase system HPr-like phosphotransfer protein